MIFDRKMSVHWAQDQTKNLEFYEETYKTAADDRWQYQMIPSFFDTIATTKQLLIESKNNDLKACVKFFLNSNGISGWIRYQLKVHRNGFVNGEVFGDRINPDTSLGSLICSVQDVYSKRENKIRQSLIAQEVAWTTSKAKHPEWQENIDS